MSSVRLACQRLAARAVEPREPLLLLHGLFGSGSNFRSLASAFAAERTVLLPDLRNHGASPWAADASIETMAKDVIELLDANGLERAALCGHSLGGKVVMAAALQEPTRVSALCVLDIAPVLYDASAPAWAANRAIAKHMADLPPSSLASRAAAIEALAPVASEMAVRQFLAMNLLPEGGGWRINCSALVENMTEFQGFPNLPAPPASLPTLFIAGSRSPYLRAEHHAAARSWFPSAQFAAVEAGHWIHAEAPKPVADMLSSFLHSSEAAV